MRLSQDCKDPVMPQCFATSNHTRREKNRRRYVIALEDGKGIYIVVAVTIIKGDCNGVLRQISASDSLKKTIHGTQSEALRENFHLAREHTRGQAGTTRIVFVIDAMLSKHRTSSLAP